MWAVIPFFSALALLVSFFAFHAWETKRKKRLFDAYRTELDAKVSRFYRMLVMGEVPASWRMAAIVFFHKTAHRAIIFSVETLRAIERPLSRLSHYMRTRPPSTNAQEVSPFLKNIAPDKNEGRRTSLIKEGESDGTTPPV